MEPELFQHLQQVRPSSPSDWDLTVITDHWQRDGAWWRKLVKRAWRRHQQQERMMGSARQLNKEIFKVLAVHGAEFHGHDAGNEGVLSLHVCHCGREFTTPQGLATHKRKAHVEFSMERLFVTGVTCASCLQFFWTKQRLQQHLAYVSRKTGMNACFQDLMRRGFDCTHMVDVEDAHGEAIATHTHTKGLHRIEKLQTFGPFPQAFDVCQ